MFKFDLNLIQFYLDFIIMALACVKVHIFQYLPCFLSCLCVCNLLFIHYFKVFSFQFKKKKHFKFPVYGIILRKTMDTDDFRMVQHISGRSRWRSHRYLLALYDQYEAVTESLCKKTRKWIQSTVNFCKYLYKYCERK